VSIEEKASGETLEPVLIMCKILAYDKSKKRAPRMAVDLSSSRTAFDATMKLEDLRVIGVQVRHFLEKEALTYAMKRMPRSLTLKDANRIAQIARKVVSTSNFIISLSHTT
jgi:hypothetical protein